MNNGGRVLDNGSNVSLHEEINYFMIESDIPSEKFGNVLKEIGLTIKSSEDLLTYSQGYIVTSSELTKTFLSKLTQSDLFMSKRKFLLDFTPSSSSLAPSACCLPVLQEDCPT